MLSVLAIECGIDPDYEGRLITSATKLGLQVLIVAWDAREQRFCLSDGQGSITERLVPDPSLRNVQVWFHGSIQACVAAQEHTRWQVHAPWDALKCSSYYPKLQGFVGPDTALFQKGWRILPLGDFINERDLLVDVLYETDTLFVRPDTNDKVFSGGCVSKSTWDENLKNILFYEPPMDTLIVIARPRQVVSEARFLVVNHRLVTGSYYKVGSQAMQLRVQQYSPVWQQAQRLLDVCLTNAFHPSYSWVLDVAEDSRGVSEIIEVGGSAYCGMYACDTDAFLTALYGGPET